MPKNIYESGDAAKRQQLRNLEEKLFTGVKVIKEGHRVKGINGDTGDETIVALSFGERLTRKAEAYQLVKVLKGDL